MTATAPHSGDGVGELALRPTGRGRDAERRVQRDGSRCAARRQPHQLGGLAGGNDGADADRAAEGAAGLALVIAAGPVPGALLLSGTMPLSVAWAWPTVVAGTTTCPRRGPGWNSRRMGRG